MTSVELLFADEQQGYKLYQSNLVLENKDRFVEMCNTAKKRFDEMFSGASTTWMYRSYNFFSLTAGFNESYDLLSELNFVVRNHLKTDERLWFQSWFNFHRQDEVLKKHHHEECITHGYIVIEPKKTRTVFENFEVVNKTGIIYIGSPNSPHEVIVDEPFDGVRLTIAFDIFSEKDFKNLVQKHGNRVNLSNFPLNGV